VKKSRQKKFTLDSNSTQTQNFTFSFINEMVDQVTGKIDKISSLPSTIKNQTEDFKQFFTEIKNDIELQNCFNQKNKTACELLGQTLGDKIMERSENIYLNLQLEGNNCFVEKDREACLYLMYKFGHFGFNVVKCGFGGYSSCLTVIDYVAEDQREKGEQQVMSFKNLAKVRMEQAVVMEGVLREVLEKGSLKGFDIEEVEKMGGDRNYTMSLVEEKLMGMLDENQMNDRMTKQGGIKLTPQKNMKKSHKRTHKKSHKSSHKKLNKKSHD